MNHQYNHFKILTINDNSKNKDNSNIFFKLWRNKTIKNVIIDNLQQFRYTKYNAPIELDYWYESLEDRYFYSSIIIKFDRLFKRQFINRLLQLPQTVKTLHIKFNDRFQISNVSNYIPTTVITLKLESSYPVPIPVNFIPPTIKVLYFSKYFNSHISKSAFPINSQLVSIDFGDYFNQKIEPYILPKSLTTIKFSKKFNQRLELGSIPQSVKSIIFGNDYNRLLRSDAIPPGCNITKIMDPTADQPPQTIQLNKRYDYKIYVPNYINVLFIGPNCSSDVFDKLDNINQQSQIHTITLNSYGFVDFSIVSSINTLRTLKFGNDFTQPVGGYSFPESLHHLIFGESFDQTITNDLLPWGLKTLVLQSSEIDIQYPIKPKVYVTKRNDIIRQKCVADRKLFKITKFF